MLDPKAEIEKNFPDIVIDSIDPAGEGMDSKAFLVNQELIFRFPKFEDIAEKLKTEISLLPKLHSYLELQIPEFKYIGHQENNFPFVGYSKIGGEALEKELFESLDRETQERLIKQIADFFLSLHSFPVSEAEAASVLVTDFKEKFSKELETLRNEAYHLLNKEAQSYIENLINQYLSDDSNFSYKPVLLHADLSPEHILYDSTAKRINGIIDFGDIQIGDPAYDFVCLYEDYGAEFTERVLAAWSTSETESMLKRITFFKTSNIWRDILIGVRRKDDIILKEALDSLQSNIQKFHV